MERVHRIWKYCIEKKKNSLDFNDTNLNIITKLDKQRGESKFGAGMDLKTLLSRNHDLHHVEVFIHIESTVMLCFLSKNVSSRTKGGRFCM